MALTFNGSAKLVGANLITGYPFTVAVKFKPTALTATEALVSGGDFGGGTEFGLWAGGAVAGDPARAWVSDNAGGGNAANSIAAMQAGVYQSAMAVFRADNSRSIYLKNRAEMVTENTSRVLTFSNFDRFIIGMRGKSDTLGFNGDLAEVVAWSYAAQHDDFLNYLYGVPSDQIQPQALIDYWPLATQAATQTGVKGNVLTATGTTQAAAHPDMNLAIPADAPIRDGGAWCWFSEPRALYYDGKLFVGSVHTNGSIIITRYVIATGARAYFVLSANFEIDDHDNPTIWIRPDGRIVVFWSLHADTTGIRYRVSTNPGDITSWGAEQVIPTPVPGNWLSYNNPRYLSANSTLYQHFRALKTGSERPHWVVKSTDNGATWDTPVETFKQAGQRPYVKSIVEGADRIHFFMSQGNPGEGGLITNVYYCLGKVVGGVLRYYKKPDATVELTLPISINADLDKVYDSALYGNVSGWQWDCKIDSNGYPRILFERTISSSDGRCCVVKWLGTAWAAHVEVTPLGARISTDPSSEYTGGMCFSATDVNKVYVGHENGGYCNIEEWVSADDGATWSKSQNITTTTTVGVKNARPYAPLGPSNRVKLLWWGGTYNSYTDYDTDIFALVSSLTQRRAMIWGSSSTIQQITDADVGTGKKPLVWHNGELKQRSAAEGLPLIWDGSNLRGLDSGTEELVV